MERVSAKEIERATRARTALEHGDAAVNDPHVLGQVRSRVVERLKAMGHEVEELPQTNSRQQMTVDDYYDELTRR